MCAQCASRGTLSHKYLTTGLLYLGEEQKKTAPETHRGNHITSPRKDRPGAHGSLQQDREPSLQDTAVHGLGTAQAISIQESRPVVCACMYVHQCVCVCVQGAMMKPVTSSS